MQELYRSFRFLIEVEGNGVIVGAFSGFSGIQIEVETLSARSGSDIRGVSENIPVRTKYSPVTLSKGVVNDNEFVDWLFSAAAGDFTGTREDNLYRTLNIIALNDKGERGITWTLKKAIPVGYQLSPMSGNQSELLSENLTFAIEGVARR